MNGKTSAVNEKHDFSLALGGPLYQFYLRSHLAKPPIELLRRRIVVIVLITWLPLALLSLVAGQVIGGVEMPFLQHLAVQTRFLVSLPLLLAAERIVHRRMSVTVREFVDRGIIAPEDQLRFENAVASAVRLRNSVTVEVLLLVFAFTGGYWIWKHYVIHGVSWYADAGASHFTPAGYWLAFVSLPIFRFILFRWYFRLVVWYRFLWQVSRMPLRLNALHPDRAGGLEFLSDTVFTLMPVLLAQTILLSGTIGDQIWHEGATLLRFKFEIPIFTVLLMLVVLLPQIFFSYRLYLARWIGRREYGILAARYVDDFREKWIQGSRDGKQEALLGTGDIQSLADLTNSSDVVSEMRLAPFSGKAVLILALVLVLPFLPLILTMIPLNEIIERLLKLLV